MKKILAVFCASVLCGGVYAADIIGTASVRMTSDTAAVAKKMAIDDARRQILVDKLGLYSMRDQLVPAIRSANSDDLAGLVSATKIDSEQISSTTYSANITMTVDVNAARNWLNNNDIQNWLPDGDAGDAFVMQIALRDPIADWIQINDAMRAAHVDIVTRRIFGKNVFVEIPISARTKMTIALRGAGWKTAATNDGGMHVWK